VQKETIQKDQRRLSIKNQKVYQKLAQEVKDCRKVETLVGIDTFL
jgi:hypothetical protein